MRTVYFVLVLIAVCWADDPLKNNNRPPPDKRLFVSQAVEDTLNNIVPKMVDQELALLFVNCFPNTLDTTVFFTNSNPPDTFVITGDIPAMWLRDSSGQVFPYVDLAKSDPALTNLFRGLIARQMSSVLIDPYANAFNKGPALSPHDDDIRKPPMNVYLWEGKYEIDSLAWVIKLSAHYINTTNDDTVCTPHWFNAIQQILQVIRYQQQELSQMSPLDTLYYSFFRLADIQSEVLLAGEGAPSKQCGLVRGAFRPSDDSHLLPYQVASNAFMSAALDDLTSVLSNSASGKCYSEQLSILTKDTSSIIQRAIELNGIVNHPVLGKVYAYEVDGYGSFVGMDDATIPNVLSLPYLGFVETNDPVYQATRTKLLLSNNNPYYFCGSVGCGIGSPHTGRGRIWHMAIIMQALTSTNPDEIAACLTLLKTTTAGKNFMHESINVNNAADFTRSWFAWANTLFGELILKVANEYPHLIFNSTNTP